MKCDYNKTCGHFYCDKETEYCKDDRCYQCEGMCSEGNIIHKKRMQWCMDSCPIYMHNRCSSPSSCPVTAPPPPENVVNLRIALVVLSIVIVALIIVIVILVYKLKKKQPEDEASNNTANNTLMLRESQPESKTLLHNESNPVLQRESMPQRESVPSSSEQLNSSRATLDSNTVPKMGQPPSSEEGAGNDGVLAEFRVNSVPFSQQHQTVTNAVGTHALPEPTV